jgi:hypothetical protein
VTGFEQAELNDIRLLRININPIYYRFPFLLNSLNLKLRIGFIAV